MEAMLLNSSAVHLKWKPPAQHALNGVLTSYQVIHHINLYSVKGSFEVLINKGVSNFAIFIILIGYICSYNINMI